MHFISLLNSGLRRNVLLVFSVSLLLPGLAVSATSNMLPSKIVADLFATTESFIIGGARGLALNSIDAQQKSDMPVDDWLRWERLRIRLYRTQHDWAAISERSQILPDTVPVKFRQWLFTEAALGELNAGHGKAARQHLRQLVWAGKSNAKQMAHWRRLIIRSYLIDDRIDDAKTALLRYKADYQATTDVWQVLHARVLMRAGEYTHAFRLLGDIQTLDAKLLRLHAGLKSGIYKPKLIVRQARRLAGQSRLKEDQQRKIWVLAAQAARKLNDDQLSIAFLELALNIRISDVKDAPFFPIKADDLWQGYINLAERVGNRERLLVGDDESWLKKAEKLAVTENISSRAIFGFLAVHAATIAMRDKAHQKLTDALFADAKQTVARALYAHTNRFKLLADIPDTVRYKLANAALIANDIRQAARWMKDLHQLPAGEDADQWVLRRARTLIYAGDSKPAIKLLRNMLRERESLPADLAKRTIQVLFDLQAVQEHGDAYEIMQLVFIRVDANNLRRELLYWMGESKAALGNHEKAAELYLRSAAYGNLKGADLWGQSARYQAAEALGKAGLTEDARNIFRGLLRASKDSKRRALIERKIQQLWLLENRNTTQ